MTLPRPGEKRKPAAGLEPFFLSSPAAGQNHNSRFCPARKAGRYFASGFYCGPYAVGMFPIYGTRKFWP